MQVAFLWHSRTRYDLPLHKAWQGGLGVWRAKPERLATVDFAVLHDGAVMWDAVCVRDAFPATDRHVAIAQSLPEEREKYDFTHGAPRCVLVADPRLPLWLEAVLGQPLPLPPARAVVRYATVSSGATGLEWLSA